MKKDYDDHLIVLILLFAEVETLRIKLADTKGTTGSKAEAPLDISMRIS